MRFIQLITFIVFLLAGCMTIKTVPLKGSYTSGNFEKVTTTQKDKVWDNIVDFFSKKGLSIRIIDRSSGLIISSETALTWTFEDKNGKLVNPDAMVVIAKQINPNNKQPIKPSNITGEWNIRIKDAPNNQTLIAVNLVNPRYSTVFDKTLTVFTPGTLQSTGVFEQFIFDQIK